MVSCPTPRGSKIEASNREQTNYALSYWVASVPGFCRCEIFCLCGWHLPFSTSMQRGHWEEFIIVLFCDHPVSVD